MRSQEGAVFEALGQVQRFLDDNDSVLGALNASGARKALDDTLAPMGSHTVAQIAANRTSQEETAKLNLIREELRQYHMRPIAVMARQHLHEQPEFAFLRFPPWNVRGIGLMGIARDIANAAEQHVELFVSEGLAPDFVSELRALVDRFEESFIARAHARTQRAGATEGLKAEMKRGRARIAQIDSLVRPKLANNAALLRKWEVAKHIKRARRFQSAAPAEQADAAVTPTAAPKLARSSEEAATA